MKQFVAMTDEMLYRTDGPPGPLVPYRCGVFCWHQLRDEVIASTAPANTDAKLGAQKERDLLSA